MAIKVFMCEKTHTSFVITFVVLYTAHQKTHPIHQSVTFFDALKFSHILSSVKDSEVRLVSSPVVTVTTCIVTLSKIV